MLSESDTSSESGSVNAPSIVSVSLDFMFTLMSRFLLFFDWHIY